MTDRRFKAIQRLLERLAGCVVLVEGKKDARALFGQFGIDAIALCSQRTEKAVGMLDGSKPAVLLFDFDSEGERKNAEFESALNASGIKVDRSARRAFKSLFGVRTVESVPSAFERLMRENNSREGVQNGKNLR